MATRSMAIRIRAVIGVSFCRCTYFPTQPYEKPMNISFVPYDFPEKILNIKLTRAPRRALAHNVTYEHPTRGHRCPH